MEGVGLKPGLEAGGYSSGLVSYDAVDLEGGAEYKSHEAMRLCKVIRERLKCMDTLNGTCYADNFDESVCTGDDEASVAKRRKLIESVAVPMCGGSIEAPVKSCMKQVRAGVLQGGTSSSSRLGRSVHFAAGHSVVDIVQEDPVVPRPDTDIRGIRVENMQAVLSGGESNCRSDPDFAWTPGAPGPDGMGYCPDDFQPGDVRPGFDNGLYQVAVAKNGQRVWTSAARQPVVFQMSDPEVAQLWPTGRVPDCWRSHGYEPKQCGAAYSFLPFADQVAALNYLIESNDPAKVSQASSGAAKAASSSKKAGASNADATTLLEELQSGKTLVSLVKDDEAIMFTGSNGEKSTAYIGGVAHVNKVDFPSGEGMMLKEDTIWIGTWGGNKETMDLSGGEDVVFEGLALSLTAQNGVKVVQWVITKENKTVKAEQIVPKTGISSSSKVNALANLTNVTYNEDKDVKRNGIVVNVGAFSIEVYREYKAKNEEDGDALVVKIGTGDKTGVKEGWVNTIGSDKLQAARRFKKGTKGADETTHLYFGETSKLGLPNGVGRMTTALTKDQTEGKEEYKVTASTGQFALGKFVFGSRQTRTGKVKEDTFTSAGSIDEGFFFNKALYKDDDNAFRTSMRATPMVGEMTENGAETANKDVKEMQKALAAYKTQQKQKAGVAVGLVTSLAGLGMYFGAIAATGGTVVVAGAMFGAYMWATKDGNKIDSDTKAALGQFKGMGLAVDDDDDDDAAGGDNNAAGGDDSALGGGDNVKITVSIVNMDTGGQQKEFKVFEFAEGGTVGVTLTDLAKEAATELKTTVGMLIVNVGKGLYLNKMGQRDEDVSVMKKDFTFARAWTRQVIVKAVDDAGKEKANNEMTLQLGVEDGRKTRAEAFEQAAKSLNTDRVYVYCSEGDHRERLNVKEMPQREKDETFADWLHFDDNDVPTPGPMTVVVVAATDVDKVTRELKKGEIEEDLGDMVRGARQALEAMAEHRIKTKTPEETKAIAELDTVSTGLFANGKAIVKLDDGTRFNDVADKPAYLAKVKQALSDAAVPCKTLHKYRNHASRYVRQKVYLITLKTIALLQYLGSSPGLDDLRTELNVDDFIDSLVECLKKVSKACFCSIEDGAVAKRPSSACADLDSDDEDAKKKAE